VGAVPPGQSTDTGHVIANAPPLVSSITKVPNSPDAGGLENVNVDAWSTVALKKFATSKSNVRVAPTLPIAEPLIA
jgi:hypothetical protein